MVIIGIRVIIVLMVTVVIPVILVIDSGAKAVMQDHSVAAEDSS